MRSICPKRPILLFFAAAVVEITTDFFPNRHPPQSRLTDLRRITSSGQSRHLGSQDHSDSRVCRFADVSFVPLAIASQGSGWSDLPGGPTETLLAGQIRLGGREIALIVSRCGAARVAGGGSCWRQASYGREAAMTAELSTELCRKSCGLRRCRSSGALRQYPVVWSPGFPEAEPRGALV